MSWETAGRLDEIFTEMLASGAEVATRHFESVDDAPA